jgi:hypothetical protein
MMMRSPRRLAIGALAVIALVAVAAGAVVLMTRSEDESVPGHAGSVNGVTFTEEELAEARLGVEAVRARLRARIEEGSGATEQLTNRVALLEDSDPEAVALASVITTLALYSRGLEEGAGATDAEIADHVEVLRNLVEADGLALDDASPGLQRHLDELGAEVFWSEYYPTRAERTVTIDNFLRARQRRAASAGDTPPSREDIEREVVTAAEIEAPGDLDAALEWLDRYWRSLGSTPPPSDT